MKKKGKIIGGIGCGLLLLGAVVIVAGYFALNMIEKRLGESTPPFEAEGRKYGETTDKNGCMSEGVRRAAKIGLLDMSDAVSNSAFVDACLETSRPVSGFCDGVPTFWSMKDTEWSSEQCRKAGVDPERTGCVHVLKRKHEFCSKPF